MNESGSPEEIFPLLPNSNAVESLNTVTTLLGPFAHVHHPDELDAATKEMGKPALLLNCYLATRVDLSRLQIGIGPAILLPLQITGRDGGRESIFFSAKNKEIPVGLYVAIDKLALRYMERTTGADLLAREGDHYTTRIKNLEGKVVYEGQAKLEHFDPQTGTGHFTPIDPATGPVDSSGQGVSSACWLFSLITYQPDFLPDWPTIPTA
jgi:hypothetical protein